MNFKSINTSLGIYILKFMEGQTQSDRQIVFILCSWHSLYLLLCLAESGSKFVRAIFFYCGNNKINETAQTSGYFMDQIFKTVTLRSSFLRVFFLLKVVRTFIA